MSLKEGHYYHIYNRGINSGVLFNKPEEYKQFLRSYAYYCYLALDTYAYCLLNNHFHFLVRVRDTAEQKRLFHSYRQQNPEKYHGLKYSTFKPQISATQYGHLFNSYTRWFNMRNEATGARFEGRFKRIEVNNREYRAHLLCYIHRNPIHHHLTKNYTEYRWSSYRILIQKEKQFFINRKEVFRWFGGLDGFIAAHEEMKLKLDSGILLE